MDSFTKDIITTLIIAVFFFLMLWYYKNAKRRFSKLLFGVLSGIAALYPAGYIATALGGVLNVNLFTLLVSGTLGIPGTALLLIGSVM